MIPIFHFSHKCFGFERIQNSKCLSTHGDVLWVGLYQVCSIVLNEGYMFWRPPKNKNVYIFSVLYKNRALSKQKWQTKKLLTLVSLVINWLTAKYIQPLIKLHLILTIYSWLTEGPSRKRGPHTGLYNTHGTSETPSWG